MMTDQSYIKTETIDMKSDAKLTKSQDLVIRKCTLSRTALKQKVPKILDYYSMKDSQQLKMPYS